jgi:putative ABC transport system permease protein
MPSPLRVSMLLALRGLERGNKFTLCLTVLIMGLVLVMLLFQPSLMTGFIKVEHDQITNLMYGNLVLEPKEHQLYIKNVSILTEKINRIPGVIASSPRYVTAVTITYQNTSVAETLTSVTPSTENQVLTLSSQIISGNYLTDGDNDQIVIGTLLAGHKDTTLDLVKSLGGVEVGDSVEVTFSNGVVRTYHVKGIFETHSMMLDQTAYITNSEMEAVTGLSDEASLVLVKTSSTGNEDAFRTTMMQYGIQEPIKTWVQEGEGFVWEVIASFEQINSIMIVFSLIIGAIVVFIVTFINTINKRKQIAILKAIGITKEVIITSFLIQVICICLAGILIGLVLFEIIIYYLTINPIQFPIGAVPPVVDLEWTVKNIIALILVSLVGGFIPAWKIANEEITDAMRG